jgi:hypothetical protein
MCAPEQELPVEVAGLDRVKVDLRVAAAEGAGSSRDSGSRDSGSRASNSTAVLRTPAAQQLLTNMVCVGVCASQQPQTTSLLACMTVAVTPNYCPRSDTA